jgi:hypothetical protein
MSPLIRAVDFSEPIQCFGRSSGEGGMTSATGSPKRVMRTGLPVLRTRSSTARQVALNFEIEIVSMRRIYYGQGP